jgi:alkanesulfonate monooxygenase SsuD/methylene tetrahydromethanopterin reductase-like flavin-dependent oxidoreductase (luciferase family)
VKLSLYLNPQTRGPHQDAELIATNIRQAISLTDSGFAGVVLTEHHLSDYNTYADNIVMAAHLAGQLRSGTRLFLATVVPPLHNPVRLAAQLNLLDVLTRGNVIVGFGAGGTAPVESVGLGRDPNNRYEDQAAVLDAMSAVMNKNPDDPPVRWSTRFESGSVYTRVMPAPYRPGGPAMAKAAVTDEAAREAGEKGLYLFTARVRLDALLTRLAIYRSGLEAAGLDGDAIAERMEWSFCQKQVIVRETDEEAREEALSRMASLKQFAQDLTARAPELSTSKRTASVHYADSAMANDFFDQAYIVGSPATVGDELARYQAAGIRHLALYFNFTFMTTEESDASIDLFMREVFPQFAPDPIPANATASYVASH